MKKVIIAAIALTFAGYTNAAPVNTPDTNVLSSSDLRKPIKVEDLPEAVKKTLASSAYEGWTADSAYLIEGTGSSFYEISLTKDAEKKFIKLDGEGNTVN